MRFLYSQVLPSSPENDAESTSRVSNAEIKTLAAVSALGALFSRTERHHALFAPWLRLVVRACNPRRFQIAEGSTAVPELLESEHEVCQLTASSSASCDSVCLGCALTPSHRHAPTTGAECKPLWLAATPSSRHRIRASTSMKLQCTPTHSL